MSEYQEIHNINDYLTLCLSLVLNIPLIFLIQKKSPSVLKPYAKLIMISVIFDLIFTITNFCTRMDLDIHDKKIFMIMADFMARIPHPWAFILVAVYWFTFFFVCVISKPVAYLVRYVTIVKNKKINFFYLILCYIVAFLITLSAMVMPCLELAENVTEHKFFDLLLNDDRNWTVNGFLPTFLVADSTENMVAIMFLYIIFLILLSYLIIIIFACKIYAKLSHFNATNIKRIQQQISFILLVQTFIPMALTGAPIAIITMGLLSEEHVWDMGSLILIMSFSWIPILNPLMTILLISAYRNAITKRLGCFACCGLKKTEVQTISVRKSQMTQVTSRSTMVK